MDADYEDSVDGIFLHFRILGVLYYAMLPLLVINVIGFALLTWMLVSCLKISSTTFHLLVATAAEFLLMLVIVLHSVVEFFYEFRAVEEIQVHSNAWCKVSVYLMNFVRHLFHWMTTVIAIECYVHFKYPKQKDVMLNWSLAHTIARTLVTVALLLNGHFFWTFSLKLTKNETPQGLVEQNRYCNYENPSYMRTSITDSTTERNKDRFNEVLWPALDMLAASILPITLTSGFLLACIHALSQRLRVKRGEHKRALQVDANLVDGQPDAERARRVLNRFRELMARRKQRGRCGTARRTSISKWGRPHPEPRAYRETRRLLMTCTFITFLLGLPRQCMETFSYLTFMTENSPSSGVLTNPSGFGDTDDVLQTELALQTGYPIADLISLLSIPTKLIACLCVSERARTRLSVFGAPFKRCCRKKRNPELRASV